MHTTKLLLSFPSSPPLPSPLFPSFPLFYLGGGERQVHERLAVVLEGQALQQVHLQTDGRRVRRQEGGRVGVVRWGLCKKLKKTPHHYSHPDHSYMYVCMYNMRRQCTHLPWQSAGWRAPGR